MRRKEILDFKSRTESVKDHIIGLNEGYGLIRIKWVFIFEL